MSAVIDFTVPSISLSPARTMCVLVSGPWIIPMNPVLSRTMPLTMTSLISSPGRPAGLLAADVGSLPRASRLMNG